MNLEEKLGMLKLNLEDKLRIESLPYKAKYFEVDEIERKIEIVDVNKVIGMLRPDADQVSNWLEALEISARKLHNFYKFKGKSQFELFLMNPDPEMVGYPILVSIEDELYIEGEGKHRLIFAKCLEIKQLKAIVKYI